MQSRMKQDSRTIIRFGFKKILGAFALGLFAVLLRILGAFRKARPPQGACPTFFVIEPFGLGDIISFEPLVRHLVALNCEVRLCAREEWRVLYPAGPVWVPARIPWASHASSAKYRLGDYFSPKFRQVLRDLRTAGAGCVGLDTRGDIRSVLLLYLAGCRRVVTLKNYLGSDLMMMPGAAELVPFDPRLRRWELNLAFLDHAGLAQGASAASPFFAHLALPPSTARPRRIAFMAVAPWAGKLWKRENWLRLAETLQSAGWEIAGICGPGQTALAVEELGVRVPVLECGSIQEWARELAGFSAVVTLDSGPMHLADALGIPVVALFGQGLLPLWAPSGPRSVVVSHQADADFNACQPVDANTELGRKFMHRISVAEVLAGLENVGIQTASPTSGH